MVAMRWDIITVDIDKPYRMGKELIRRRLSMFPELGGIVAGWECRPSPSGKTHCVVYLYHDVRDCTERARLAALLGDDPARTWLNYVRCVKDGDPMEILFVSKYPRVAAAWPGAWFWG